MRRLYTSCRTDGKSVEIHYTLVKTESGHLIQIAHLKLGDATGDVANADSAFLQERGAAELQIVILAIVRSLQLIRRALAPLEQLLDIGELELDIGRTAVIALARERRLLPCREEARSSRRR